MEDLLSRIEAMEDLLSRIETMEDLLSRMEPIEDLRSRIETMEDLLIKIEPMEDLLIKIARETHERLEGPSLAEIDAALQQLVEEGRAVRIEGEGEPVYAAVPDR
jgi:hypothetical protein